MLERDSYVTARRVLRDGFPKLNQPRHEILERFVYGIVSLGMPVQFDDCSRKAGHRLDANVRRDFDGSEEDRAREIGLRRIERVFIKRADGGDVEIARFG